MKRFYKKFGSYFIIALISFLLFLSMGTNCQEENNVQDTQAILASINGEVITLNDFNQYWDAIPDQYKFQLSKEDLLEQLIVQELLIQRAKEINLDSDSEVAFQIKNTTEQILIQFLIEKEVVEKTELTEEEIESYYEEHKEDFWKNEEIHALNILTDTEEEAQEALNRLKEGEDFSALAKEISVASNAAQGGDIGFISKGTLTTEIEEQLFVLNPDELSGIITTERGFYIFKIIEKNAPHYIDFDEVKDEIKNQLLPQKQQQAFDQYLTDIEDKATIEKNLELIAE